MGSGIDNKEMIVELKYSIYTKSLYYKFLNWLEGEYCLHQASFIGEALYINLPLVSCVVKKNCSEGGVPEVKVKISGQPSQEAEKLMRDVDDLYQILRHNYL